MLVNRSVGASTGILKSLGDPAKGLCRAEEGIVGSRMAYFLATNAVLLVIEFQGSMGDTLDVARVIQRSIVARVGAAVKM